MREHNGSGVGWIGIDPEEADTAGIVSALESLDFGNIAIGDGAVRGGKKEDHGFGARGRKTIDGPSMEVGAEGLGGEGKDGNAEKSGSKETTEHRLEPYHG